MSEIFSFILCKCQVFFGPTEAVLIWMQWLIYSGEFTVVLFVYFSVSLFYFYVVTYSVIQCHIFWNSANSEEIS